MLARPVLARPALARVDVPPVRAQVVFASLAITFLLEIDDQLMETLCDRIDHGPAHRAVVAGYRRALSARIVGRAAGGRAAAVSIDRTIKVRGA